MNICWYNDASTGYDPTHAPGTYVNCPGTWQIQVSQANGGSLSNVNSGNPWKTVYTTTGNVLTSGQIVLNLFAGGSNFNWVQFLFTSAAGSSTAVSMKVDIYNITHGCSDGWLFIGDNTTVSSMDHGDTGSVACASFGDLCNAAGGYYAGYYPSAVNAGINFWPSSSYAAYLVSIQGGNTIQNHPGRFVAVNLGYSDAVNGYSTSQFYTNMASIVQLILQYGKVPVIPTIPWDPTYNVSPYNTQLTALKAAYPSILSGPDFYSYYSANPTLIASTGTLTDQGAHDMRSMWATMAASISPAATATISNPAATCGVAGFQQCINAIRATGAQNVVALGGLSYCDDLSGWLANAPVDPAGQMAAAWHPYPPCQQISNFTISNGGSGYAVNDIVAFPYDYKAKSLGVYWPAFLKVTAISGSAITAGTMYNTGHGQSGGTYLQTMLPSNPMSAAPVTLLTGYMASNVLTATSVTGTLTVGQYINGTGISANNVYVTGFLSGTPGGAGTYSISSNATVGSSGSPISIIASVQYATTSGNGLQINVSSWANQSSQWSLPSNWPAVEAIRAQHPIIITEVDDTADRLPTLSPWVTPLIGFCESQNISITPWCFTPIGFPGAGPLITDGAADPTVGYGVNYQTWTANHGNGAQTMPMIGRGLPVYADSGTPANAVDGDYHTQWIPTSVPSHITIDISTVTAAMATDGGGWKTMLYAWYTNDPDYQPYQGSPGNADIPSNYTIDTNTAPGGTGSEPTSGWVTGVVTVTGNIVHSRTHLINVAGVNWVRLNITSMPAGQVAPAQLNIDLWDASRVTNAGHTAYNGGWITYGDSIMSRCLGQGWADSNAQVATSLGQQVNALTNGTYTPVQENGGFSGISSGGILGAIAGWVTFFPGKFAVVACGTNDAASGVTPATFYSNMSNIINILQSAGKTVIIPTILYSTEPTHLANIPALNAQIQALYTAYPTVVPGPDLWNWGLSNQILMASDQIHPVGAGCAYYRTIWANFVALVGRGA